MTDVINRLDRIEQRLDDYPAHERRRRVWLASFLLAADACAAYVVGLLVHLHFN
jgi:hypothetical protein